MLKIFLLKSESFDEATQEFISEMIPVSLEHSLSSVSKWESRFKKPFLSKDAKTTEEVLGYIESMVIDPDFDLSLLTLLSDQNIKEVNDYINDSHTATWFHEPKRAPNTEIITSELIYYWMTSCQIPLEAEHWHLARLFTLIKIFSVKNAKPKKKSAREIADERRELNERRKQMYNTSG